VNDANADHPERTYLLIRSGPKPEEAYGRHWCFKARQRAQVDAFWRAGLSAGGSDEGPPGLRPEYHPDYNIIRTTMGRSCVIPTAIAWRRCAIAPRLEPLSVNCTDFPAEAKAATLFDSRLGSQAAPSIRTKRMRCFSRRLHRVSGALEGASRVPGQAAAMARYRQEARRHDILPKFAACRHRLSN